MRRTRNAERIASTTRCLVLMQTRAVLIAAVALASGTAVGVFGGLAAWKAYGDHQAAAVAAAASEAATKLASSPAGRQREALKRFVNDPASVEFRFEHESTNNPLFWCGELNAKNRMGAFVGFTRYVVELSKTAPELDQVLALDPRSSGDSETQRFTAFWDGYCKAQ